MSKILKYHDILMMHDDKYIIDKKNVQADHNPVCIEKDREPDKVLAPDIIYAQADDILANTRARAEKILIDAQIKAESIKNKAYETGYSDGKVQGYEEGYSQAIGEANKTLDVELQKIEELRMEIHEKKATLLRQSEGELVALALEVAKKIVDSELQDGQVYNGFIKKALKGIKGRDNIKLYVNEEDFSRVSSNREYIISSVEGLDDIEIISDKYLTQGSCIVDGGIGIIDGSVDTQLKQIEKALKSVLNCEES